LQRAGSLRIENPARDIDVRDGIPIEQKIATLQVMKEREKRDEEGDSGHAGRAAVERGGCFCSHSTPFPGSS